MSPSQFREANGQRASPLKISKESHLIHKSPPSSSSSSSSSTPPAVGAAVTVAATPKRQIDHHPHQQRHPVIIYTHSPKIIRTEARDFMALVQKLTGMSRSEDAPPPRPPSAEARPSSSEGNNSSRVVASDDSTSSSSSVLTDDQINDQVQAKAADPVSPVFDAHHNNPFFNDIPLFAPNSSDFFCSPPPSAYRYPDAVFASPNVGGTNTLSPSVMDVLNLKTYQGY
ncbi:hypothetical protein H6P81_000908 [Aristolochia fimbriata]|uniref:VQ domain-containing protein n=1 Tax=Aristolochia fimbriata TaxID=158543 RepID=A0AAV7F814_ARIFI|nr:hypothetical protein H6P81_000908 [Aristolochia fimbriata]